MRQVAKYYAILGKQTFSPLDLSPALWLDASDATTITASSGAVSQWDDKSGNGRHVSQATAAAQPTTGAATINGLNVLSFDGTGDFLRNAAQPAQITNPSTTFVVAKANSTTGLRSFFNNASSPPVAAAMFTTLVGGSRQFQMYTTDFRVFGNVTDTNANVYYALINNPNMTLGANGSYASVANSSTARGAGAVVGSNSGGTGEFWPGTIAEILVYSGALSDTDRDKVQTYLATKWGI